jgi:hypothetical protein
MQQYPGMTRKAIRARLVRVVDKWIATLPLSLGGCVKKSTIVTGGCIASMLLGERVKDYDIYLDNIDTLHKLTKYYVDQFNNSPHKDSNNIPHVIRKDDRVKIIVRSAGIAGDISTEEPYIDETSNEETLGLKPPDVELEDEDKNENENDKFYPRFLSENAITLSDKVQIVIRFWGDAAEIHKNYDFVHATNYYHAGTDKLYFQPQALECLLSKTLVYQGSLYPVCSLFRIRKFMERGWKISAGEMTKIALQISELDLTNIEILKEQLIGVDALYFYELIVKLKAWQYKNQASTLDMSYIIELIDEMAENNRLGLN